MTGEGKGRKFSLRQSHDRVASFTIPQSALPRGRGRALLGTDFVVYGPFRG